MKNATNNSYNRERALYYAGFLIILLLCIPYFVLGENAYIIVHDNLDGVISNLKLLKEHNALFDADAILPMMDGIKRSSFGNEWNITLIPFLFLPYYWGYVVNMLLVKITGYVGMSLLLQKYITKDVHSIVIVLVAMAFACIPYYATVCGISAAGIPLLIYALLNLKNNKHIPFSYGIVAYYALYSFLPFSGMFVCAYLLLYGIYLTKKEHKLNYHYTCGFCLLCLIYLLTNYNLLTSFLIDSTYVSHRTEFVAINLASTMDIFKYCRDIIYFSQYHAGPFPGIYILIIYICSLGVNRTSKMWTIGGILLFMAICIFTAKCLPVIFSDIHFFQEFQFDRFYFLYPCIGFTMLAIALENMYIYAKETIEKRNINFKHIKLNQAIFVLLTVLFVPIIKSLYNSNQEFKSAIHVLKGKTPTQPTFKQFYDEPLFSNIACELNIDPALTKVVSIGLFPAIAEYNGFYCLDGYMSDYSLVYKHHFRQIIRYELDRDNGIKSYFDEWGNRCYIFSSELNEAMDKGLIDNPYMVTKDDTLSITPQYNTDVLKQLGAQFIFSALPLNNFCELGLQERGQFTTNESLWRIYIYEIE